MPKPKNYPNEWLKEEFIEVDLEVVVVSVKKIIKIRCNVAVQCFSVSHKRKKVRCVCKYIYLVCIELGRHSSKCKQMSRSNLKIVDNPFLPHEKEVNLCIIQIFPVSMSGCT